MSFRTRLSLFFVMIVVVPMVSLTFVLFGVIADSENGKADAALAARESVAVSLAGEATAAAERGALAVGRDEALATALQRREPAAARRRATQLLGTLRLKRIVVGAPGAQTVVDVGARTAILPARRRLVGADGTGYGTLEVSAQGPQAFAMAVARVARVGVIVRSEGRVLASTVTGRRATPPIGRRGLVTLRGSRLRARTFTRRGLGAARTEVTVLAPVAPSSREIRQAKMLAGGILLGFLALAVVFAALVSRSLQRQISEFLTAARRLGRGDFSAKIPTVGDDEFAALAGEFNRMSGELERRLEDLRAEQARLAKAMRRVGETFAANLDRDGLLEIVLRTALDGAGAQAGRAGLCDAATDGLRTVARVGDEGASEAALAAAERAALSRAAPAEVSEDGAHALAHPLGRVAGERTVSGAVSIARTDRPFTGTERELFEYLARQAIVSIENVGLHETVERQAITDELTGLANRRRFQATLDQELERSRRFGTPLSLVLLDIDDFKRVNDTHGHQTGDLVLHEVGRVVRECSREVDTPARYGGEELALLLPGTDAEGAFNLADRVRRAVAALTVPLPDGSALHVTASFGAATRPEVADDARELVQAADTALYDAKRSGKNRTVSASRILS